MAVELSPWLRSEESACNVGDTGDLGLIPGSGRAPGGEHGNPLQYSCLENTKDRATQWTAAHQLPLFMGFSRQEYWSRLLCTPPGALPDPGIKPVCLMSVAFAGRLFTTGATWEAPSVMYSVFFHRKNLQVSMLLHLKSSS